MEGQKPVSDIELCKGISGRFLEFSLGEEQYGVPLLNVKEVISVPETTAIPKAPSYFKGIMNLRGHIISILDLRLKLGVEFKKGSRDEAVIILDFSDFHVGIIVDSVNKVLNVEEDEVSDLPIADSKVKAEYVAGVFRRAEELVLLVDIARALEMQDLMIIKEKQSA